MNMEMVDRNSAPEEFVCIWQSKLVGIITIDFRANRLYKSKDTQQYKSEE